MRRAGSLAAARKSLTSGPTVFTICSVTDATEMQARHAEALKVLAERALALACAVQERALNAETDAGMAELGLAFHRISRTMRQCLALEAKLARDAEQAVREARTDAARERGAEVKRRKQFLRTVLTRNIWDADDLCEDSDASEAAVRVERLESLLDEDEFGDDLLALPVGEQIARLRDDLGLAEADLGGDAATPEGAPGRFAAYEPGSGGGASPAFATLQPNSS
jgi:hypothetical protein